MFRKKTLEERLKRAISQGFVISLSRPGDLNGVFVIRLSWRTSEMTDYNTIDRRGGYDEALDSALSFAERIVKELETRAN